MFADLAAERGLTPGQLAKLLALKEMDRPTNRLSRKRQTPNARQLDNIRAELGRIRGLVNQVAAKANATSQVDSLHRIQESVEVMRMAVLVALNHGRPLEGDNGRSH